MWLKLRGLQSVINVALADEIRKQVEGEAMRGTRVRVRRGAGRGGSTNECD